MNPIFYHASIAARLSRLCRFVSGGKRLLSVIGAALLLSFVSPFASAADETAEAWQAVFDAEYYYNQNPDLQAAIGNDPQALFSHFMSSGMRECRPGNEEFDVRAYVFHNPDLVNQCKTDIAAYYRHYMTAGKAEGRICQPQGSENGRIGTYTTNYNSAIPRAVNVCLAAQRINGTVLQPGEQFSFSNAVQPRRPENGYVLAPAIGGQEYGGGICQVSSTLYAAMCHALLPASERHPHSSPVSYLPVGLDATISEGRKDLKFVNPYQEPLLIQASAQEGNLTVTLIRGDAAIAEIQAAAAAEAEAQAAAEAQEAAEAEAQAAAEAEAQAAAAAQAQAEAEAQAEAAEAQAAAEAEAQAQAAAAETGDEAQTGGPAGGTQ